MNTLPRKSRRRGFTLVELVVVILILGIIAAIAAPKMFDTANEAKVSATRQSLAVVRDAIQLYRAKYGALPGEAGTEADLKSDLRNVLNGSFPRAEVGNAGDTIRVATAGTALAASGTESWAYDKTSGEFVVNDAACIVW